MKILKLFVIAFFATVLVTSLVLTPAVNSQGGPTEAPALFDNLTNGFTSQAQFDADRAAFEEREEIADGLGPIYNAQACVECHQNRVTGGVSQIMELRAGHSGPDGTFVNAPGGSLINSRSINTTIQERVPGGPLITYVNNTSLVSLVSFDIDAGVLNNLTGTTGHSFPAYSPDGTRIAFAESGNIWVVNNDGTNPNKISFDGDSHPSWSPDGTKIAFSSTRTGVAQIFTMTPIGTDVTNISNDPNGQDRFSYLLARRNEDSLPAHSDQWPQSGREDLDDERERVGADADHTRPRQRRAPDLLTRRHDYRFQHEPRRQLRDLQDTRRWWGRNTADEQRGFRPKSQLGGRQFGNRLRQRPQRRPENLGHRN